MGGRHGHPRCGKIARIIAQCSDTPCDALDLDWTCAHLACFLVLLCAPPYLHCKNVPVDAVDVVGVVGRSRFMAHLVTNTFVYTRDHAAAAWVGYLQNKGFFGSPEMLEYARRLPIPDKVLISLSPTSISAEIPKSAVDKVRIDGGRAVSILALGGEVSRSRPILFMHVRSSYRRRSLATVMLNRAKADMQVGNSMTASAPACQGWLSTLAFLANGFGADFGVTSSDVMMQDDLISAKSSTFTFDFEKKGELGSAADLKQREEHVDSLLFAITKQWSRKTRNSMRFATALTKILEQKMQDVLELRQHLGWHAARRSAAAASSPQVDDQDASMTKTPQATPSPAGAVAKEEATAAAEPAVGAERHEDAVPATIVSVVETAAETPVAAKKKSRKPPGRVPKGKEWSYELNAWVDIPVTSVAAAEAAGPSVNSNEAATTQEETPEENQYDPIDDDGTADGSFMPLTDQALRLAARAQKRAAAAAGSSSASGKKAKK